MSGVEKSKLRPDEYRSTDFEGDKLQSPLLVEAQALRVVISLSKSVTAFHVADILYGLVKIPVTSELMTSFCVTSELMMSEMVTSEVTRSDGSALTTSPVIFRFAGTIEVSDKPSITGGLVSTTTPFEDEVFDKPAPLMAVTVKK